jgi:hypothetical protein
MDTVNLMCECDNDCSQWIHIDRDELDQFKIKYGNAIYFQNHNCNIAVTEEVVASYPDYNIIRLKN